jgi:hypothetical protein
MRALCRITAIVQLVLPLVVSVADARLERDANSARAYSHVEAHTGKDCVRVHRADCALCQHLTTPAAKSAKPVPPVAVARCELPAVTLAAGLVSAHAPRPSLPRGPPTA